MKENEKKKRPPKQDADDILPLDIFALMQNTVTDPQGMYTGVPVNPFDDPVQDADDL